MKCKIFVLIGASGTGKISLANHLHDKLDNTKYEIYNFDSIGVPQSDEMTRLYGSPTEWQKVKTEEWIKKLTSHVLKKTIIFEGQMNPNFVREAFKELNFKNYEIILIDCEEKELIRRLVEERNQPELANEDMLNWLKYLRQESKKYNYKNIDTTRRTIHETGKILIRKFNLI